MYLKDLMKTCHVQDNESNMPVLPNAEFKQEWHASRFIFSSVLDVCFKHDMAVSVCSEECQRGRAALDPNVGEVMVSQGMTGKNKINVTL